MRPASAVGVSETLSFVRRHLRGRRRILEVGCGTGELAERLSRLGHAVVAIDLSRKAVSAARGRGVDARVADICSFDERTFDAVLFTRSLHHVRTLAYALKRGLSLLKPGGLLLIEDFARERMDVPTARWLYGLRPGSQKATCGKADHAGRRAEGDPLRRWRREHAHNPPLATGKQLSGAARRLLTDMKAKRVPYLYRYVGEDGGDEARALRQEKRLITLGRIRDIGLRIVGRARVL